MSLLNPRKLRKLRNDPKLFFQDAFKKRLIPLGNALKKYKPKKYKGYSKYVIVSAVYNVEKYLDDYFKSIINQRLDFKKNIHIVCVDDGSTDNSAKIIKSYQKKYPKNITYLYKENGGQASARNLGLKYLQENESLRDKFAWVTFTDPDDFLDNDYFYEVDRFLEDNQDEGGEGIGLISPRLINYREEFDSYGAHLLDKIKFNVTRKIKMSLLKNEMPAGSTSLYMLKSVLQFNILFPENRDARVNFEDVKFIIDYINIMPSSMVSLMLREAVYYVRKRSNSTTATSILKKELYLGMPIQLIHVCKESLRVRGEVDIFTQNICIYHNFWHMHKNIDSKNLSILTEQEQSRYLELLDESFSYISSYAILNFGVMLGHLHFFHKVGILNCFKGEYPPFQITYIEDFDCTKRQILLRYFTPDDKDIESLRIDGKEVYADYEKIIQHDFLTRVFTYEKRLWIHIPKDSKKLEIFIRGQRARITLGGKQHQSLEIKQIESKFKGNPHAPWLLIDRDINADDNAEHFYRYMMQNHPNQKIHFALRKSSNDWERLEKEGFNLVDFGSRKFEEIAKKNSKIISSNADDYFLKYFQNKDFIFLQHGVIMNELSRWLNNKKIALFITSTKQEYESIAGDYNRYSFGKKEVILTGLARHDSLLKKNDPDAEQILIMPTWRQELVGYSIASSLRKIKERFTESEYFQKWNGLLKSPILQELSQKYGYKVLFNPHPNIMPYLGDFEIPEFVRIASGNKSLQDLFGNSSLMITDYSSVAFEMGYLKKPVLYYQFDEEEFFKNHTIAEGYFNYRTDGFGPVVTTEEDLLKELEILLQNNCQVGEPYKSNIENTFAFRDGKCCERIYQEILKLDEPYENKISLEYIAQKAQDALNHECYQEAMWRYGYLLENSEIFEESIALKYLESAMEVEKGYEAAKLILEKLEKEEDKKLSESLSLLVIKNILSNKKAPKAEIEKCLEILETLKVPQDKEKEFLLSKLRIYFYLANRKRVNEITEELKSKHNFTKEDIHFEMLFAFNAISLWGGGQLLVSEIEYMVGEMR
ncbi:CDP-glycerol glycerophosphotransferase family protein [Helicobacter pullorum]|uniref:CDP-glycerol glycerophosphotransferase family protein n=1 Tax=Helicobacter pullorum TaxID=35818 RepID=UPI0009C16DF5|nr:CDP-glycerol glycerophosphotransferase family protein [Helicobacter pullorum]